MPGFTLIPGGLGLPGAPVSGKEAREYAERRAGVSPKERASGGARLPKPPMGEGGGMPAFRPEEMPDDVLLPLLSAARSGRSYLGIPAEDLHRVALPLEREFLRRTQVEEAAYLKGHAGGGSSGPPPRPSGDVWGAPPSAFTPPGLPPAPTLPPQPPGPPPAQLPPGAYPPPTSQVPSDVRPPGASKTPRDLSLSDLQGALCAARAGTGYKDVKAAQVKADEKILLAEWERRFPPVGRQASRQLVCPGEVATAGPTPTSETPAPTPTPTPTPTTLATAPKASMLARVGGGAAVGFMLGAGPVGALVGGVVGMFLGGKKAPTQAGVSGLAGRPGRPRGKADPFKSLKGLGADPGADFDLLRSIRR